MFSLHSYQNSTQVYLYHVIFSIETIIITLLHLKDDIARGVF